MSSSAAVPVDARRAAALPRDLRCGDCGYGIVARGRPPDRCPMCGRFDWREPVTMTAATRETGGEEWLT